MFGLFKKTQQTPEVELIELMQKLQNANSNVISALHMALCTQLNIFSSNYETLHSYQECSQKEKFDYLMKLLNMEENFNKEKMFAESIACKLLGLYLATYLEKNYSEIKESARDKFSNFISTESF